MLSLKPLNLEHHCQIFNNPTNQGGISVSSWCTQVYQSISSSSGWFYCFLDGSASGSSGSKDRSFCDLRCMGTFKDESRRHKLLFPSDAGLNHSLPPKIVHKLLHICTWMVGRVQEVMKSIPISKYKTKNIVKPYSWDLDQSHRIYSPASRSGEVIQIRSSGKIIISWNQIGSQWFLIHETNQIICSWRDLFQFQINFYNQFFGQSL